MVRRLVSLLPSHRIYVEPFCGSAGLLFAKPPSPREIINDIDGNLVAFFRVTRFRPEALAQMFEHCVVHEGIFRRLRDSACTECPTDLEKAFRFAYLVWFSFSAKGEHFARWNPAHRSLAVRRSLWLVKRTLRLASRRLRDVQIEERDFADVIKRYDSARTFFYCDPPYVNFSRNGQYVALPPSRLKELFQVLAKVRGTFLMSQEDCPEVHELLLNYGPAFKVRRIQTTYTMRGGDQRKAVRELLIANYDFTRKGPYASSSNQQEVMSSLSKS